MELTDEREAHIRSKHPELLANGYELVSTTLEDPGLVREDPDAVNTVLFSRW